MLKKVINLLDNETLLILIGDHGMNNDGTHGGNSTDEVTTTLWAYTKQGFHPERNKYPELMRFDEHFE